MSSISSKSCPLCGIINSSIYHQDKYRCYYQCNLCSLVFVTPEYWINFEAERRVYDLHQNEVHDLGYQNFLSRLVTPLSKRLHQGAQGLDFGCGPGPALQQMFQQREHDVSLYDPHYFPDREVLVDQYDFICATEVVEHLQYPREVFLQIKKCLRPDAIFAVMTQLVISQERFAKWRYIQDPTHICFYNESSLKFVAELIEKKFERVDRDVIFFY